MAKVVFKKLPRATSREAGAGSSVSSKRIRRPEGSTTVFTVDAGSERFGDDLTYVFGRNVAKARRENKRVTGTLDRVPTGK